MLLLAIFRQLLRDYTAVVAAKHPYTPHPIRGLSPEAALTGEHHD
jgi:hypothetical protein